MPKNRYEFVVIKKAQVNLDYHVEVGGHYYSVSNYYIGKTVEYHLGENSVSLIFDNQRIAIHKRSSARDGATTLADRMPHAHKRHHEWTPNQFAKWGQSVGCHTGKVVDYLIKNK